MIIDWEYRIGDVIEFWDHRFDSKDKEKGGDGFTKTGYKYVGRITSMHHMSNPRLEEHQVELWLEYYSEMQARIYVAPEWVESVLISGPEKAPREFNPPFNVGDSVLFSENVRGKSVKILDKIASIETRVDYKDGTEFVYRMKDLEYALNEGDFEACR